MKKKETKQSLSISSQRNTKCYTFEYVIKVPVSFKCDYCGQENVYEHIIKKTTIEYAYSSKALDPNGDNAIIEEVKKKDIMEALKKKAENDLDLLLKNYKENDYSLLQVDNCFSCHKQALWGLKYTYKPRILLRLLVYIGIILCSLILNIALKKVMLTIFHNVTSFFTSIFFFPTIFSLICIIAFYTDLRAFKKEYKNKMENSKNYKPVILQAKICRFENILDAYYENRL